MGKTFQQLKSEFIALTGVSDNEVTDEVFAVWLNECQQDLAYDMGTVSTTTYTATEGTAYDLPDGILRIVDCSDPHYELSDAGQIVFSFTGDVTLYYVAIPPAFTAEDADQVSTLNSTLHSLMPLWAASRYFDRESEGDPEESTHGTKWMNYYLRAKAQAMSRLHGLFGYNKLEKWTVI